MESDVKNYVLDTNVLLTDPDAIYNFAEHNVIIPLIVVEEIDKHKTRQDEVGRNARTVSRYLDELRQDGNLLDGIQIPHCGKITVRTLSDKAFDDVPYELRSNESDNIILAIAAHEHRTTGNCVLVSRDSNVRIKADAVGVPSEDYKRIRVTDDIDSLYKGVKRFPATPEWINQYHKNKGTELDAREVLEGNIYPNEFLVYKAEGETQSAIGRYHPAERMVKPVTVHEAFGLKARNKEQQFALDLLFDDRIKLVTLVGTSGTGKTLLATAAGLQQVTGPNAPYKNLIISRPVQTVGKDIGFLPGTLHEKMEPWVAPIKDNLNYLFGSQQKGRKKQGETDDPYLSLMIKKGVIEIEAIAYIRGRSIPKAFIIIDEAQNLSMHELKTIVTRVGDGTKIVLTGDIDQIDNNHVDALTNGLTCAVERFKEHPIAGHVHMIKGERSELATLASKIL